MVSKDTRLQGDVIDVDGEDHVIISRSCDVVQDSAGTSVYVAPVRPDADDWTRRGWRRRRLRVPANQDLYADLSGIASMAKETVSRSPLVLRGVADPDQSRQFRNDVARFFNVASVPDGVNMTVAPMLAELKKRRGKPGHEDIHRLILQVRARFTALRDADPFAGPLQEVAPDDENTPRSMTVIFLLAGAEPVSTPKREQPRSTVEIAQAWTDRGERSMPVVAEYCDALMTLVNEVHDPVGSITHDVRAMAEMPTIEFLRSDELEIEQMSA